MAKQSRVCFECERCPKIDIDRRYADMECVYERGAVMSYEHDTRLDVEINV